MSEPWRLVDDVARPSSADQQMVEDLRLLDEVELGAPSALRLYTWPVPALSIGRFQADTDVDRGACDRLGVEVVRRPTGGRALLHGADLTYAVVTRSSKDGCTRVDDVYRWIARGLIAGLAHVGAHADIAHSDGPAGPACFAGQQGADLRVGKRKVCGSAQVWRGGAVLQHGSILLHRLPYDETDLLVAAGGRDALRAATVTLEEIGAEFEAGRVADALIAGFMQALGCSFDTVPALRSTPRH